MAPTSERRIVVSGATGLIGSQLVAALRVAGHPVTRLVRGSVREPGDVVWDPAGGVLDVSAIEGSWAVIHLAGEGIADSKWTEAHKRAVLQSRVDSTSLLARTIAACSARPSVFASGSAMGIYGNGGDAWLPETQSRGTGFLADVVAAWEAAAAGSSVRTAFLRTSLVLTTKGGALKQQVLPFKLGLGGRLGSGKQYQSWITIDDEVRAIRHVVDTDSIEGPVNLSTPNPVTNSEFTAALAGAVRRPAVLPTPLLPLKVRYGAEMVKEMLLVSQRLRPDVLTSTGFVFNQPVLRPALDDLLARKA